MTAEWFTEPEGFIVETAWGHFQDVPIFRSLAREHNIVTDFKSCRRSNEERTRRYKEWLKAT